MKWGTGLCILKHSHRQYYLSFFSVMKVFKRFFSFQNIIKVCNKSFNTLSLKSVLCKCFILNSHGLWHYVQNCNHSSGTELTKQTILNTKLEHPFLFCSIFHFIVWLQHLIYGSCAQFISWTMISHKNPVKMCPIITI